MEGTEEGGYVLSSATNHSKSHIKCTNVLSKAFLGLTAVCWFCGCSVVPSHSFSAPPSPRPRPQGKTCCCRLSPVELQTPRAFLSQNDSALFKPKQVQTPQSERTSRPRTSRPRTSRPRSVRLHPSAGGLTPFTTEATAETSVQGILVEKMLGVSS